MKELCCFYYNLHSKAQEVFMKGADKKEVKMKCRFCESALEQQRNNNSLSLLHNHHHINPGLYNFNFPYNAGIPFPNIFSFPALRDVMFAAYLMKGYYQPAGPLISAHHQLHSTSSTITTSKVTAATVLPTPETSATPTPPPSSTSQSVPPTQGLSSASTPSITTTRGGEESPTDDLIPPTCSSAGTGGEIVPQPTPPSSSSSYRFPPTYRSHSPTHHQSYPYGYPHTQYYPSPPASASIQYPPPNPPAAHHYHSSQEPCFTGSYPPPPHVPAYYHPKSYSSPPSSGAYHRRYVPSQYYPVDLYASAHPPPASGSPGPTGQQNQQMVVSVSQSAPPRDIPPPASTLMEPYPPGPPPSVLDPYPPPPPGYYSGYTAAPGAATCYSHTPSSRGLYIDPSYQSCPCPLQACPKNVHTGPLTGDGKGPQNHAPLALSVSLPVEPGSLNSPARGSAGTSTTPSLPTSPARNPQEALPANWNQKDSTVMEPAKQQEVRLPPPPLEQETKSIKKGSTTSAAQVFKDGTEQGLLKISKPVHNTVNPLICDIIPKKEKLSPKLDTIPSLLMCHTNLYKHGSETPKNHVFSNKYKECIMESFQEANLIPKLEKNITNHRNEEIYPTPPVLKPVTPPVVKPVTPSKPLTVSEESELVSKLEVQLAQKRKEISDHDIGLCLNAEEPQKRRKLSNTNRSPVGDPKPPKLSYFGPPMSVNNSETVKDQQIENVRDVTVNSCSIQNSQTSYGQNILTEITREKTTLNGVNNTTTENNTVFNTGMPQVHEVLPNSNVVSNAFKDTVETAFSLNSEQDKHKENCSATDNSVSNVRKRTQTLLSSLKSTKKIKIDPVNYCNSKTLGYNSSNLQIISDSGDESATDIRHSFKQKSNGIYKFKSRSPDDTQYSSEESVNKFQNEVTRDYSAMLRRRRGISLDSNKMLNESSSVSRTQIRKLRKRSVRDSTVKDHSDDDTESLDSLGSVSKRRSHESTKPKTSKTFSRRTRKLNGYSLSETELMILKNAAASNGTISNGVRISNEMRQFLELMKPVPKPKWSNGWSWEGEAFYGIVFISSDDPPALRKCYSSMRHVQGDVISTLDCVLLRSGKKKDVPFVAKVAALWENPADGEMMLSVLWYYRPKHTTQTLEELAAAEDEIFSSKHKDCSSVACIEDRCYVLTLNEYARYKKCVRAAEQGVPTTKYVPDCQDYFRRNRLPPAKVDPNAVFLCHRVYDYRHHKVLKSSP